MKRILSIILIVSALLSMPIFADENNLSKNLVNNPKYLKLGDFENGKALAQLEDKRIVFVDSEGNILHDFGIHGYFSSFVNGIAVVRDEPLDGRYYFDIWETSVLDLSIVSEYQFKVYEAQPILEEIVNNLKSGYYIINENGNVLIDNLEADFKITNSQQGGVKADEPPIHEMGIMLTPLKIINSGIAVAKRNGKFGIINTAGNVLYDFIIDFYTISRNEFVYGKIKDKNVVFDPYGNPYAGISVFLDGEELSFDYPLIIENDRVLVPCLEYDQWPIFSQLSIRTEWRIGKKMIYINRGDISIVMETNNTTMTKNGEETILDVSPYSVENFLSSTSILLIPLRALAEGLGAYVDWEDELHRVVITSREQ